MLKTNFKTRKCNSNCSEMIHLRRNLIAIAEVYSQFQGRNNNQEEGLG